MTRNANPLARPRVRYWPVQDDGWHDDDIAAEVRDLANLLRASREIRARLRLVPRDDSGPTPSGGHS